jgi:hypothetical protein
MQKEIDMATAYVSEEMLQAYRRLIQLNLESWRPEVNDWLHSEEAEPELIKLLTIVPC